MDIEELSKDELIYLITHHYIFNMDNFEFDVLSYRAKKCLENANQYGRKANDLLGDYIKLLGAYDGKSLSDMPDNIIKSACEAMKQRELYLKKERIKEGEYKKINKRMDKILENISK